MHEKPEIHDNWAQGFGVNHTKMEDKASFRGWPNYWAQQENKERLSSFAWFVRTPPLATYGKGSFVNTKPKSTVMSSTYANWVRDTVFYILQCI